MGFPQRASIPEVGPRDGLQSENVILPLAERVELILAPGGSGLSSIQAASCVHPAVVGQLADAEDLVAALPAADAATYTALTLNRKGIERIARCGLRGWAISIRHRDARSSLVRREPLPEDTVYFLERLGLSI